jgi:two-component system, response regulator PdtaR
MRALIIEDEPLISWMLEQMLQDHGIANVEFATSEAQARAMADQECPELIVAESRLAHGSAINAVQAICSEKHVPTIFITLGETDLQSQFPQAALVQKPFTLVAFEAALDSVTLTRAPPMPQGA